MGGGPPSSRGVQNLSAGHLVMREPKLASIPRSHSFYTVRKLCKQLKRDGLRLTAWAVLRHMGDTHNGGVCESACVSVCVVDDDVNGVDVVVVVLGWRMLMLMIMMLLWLLLLLLLLCVHARRTPLILKRPAATRGQQSRTWNSISEKLGHEGGIPSAQHIQNHPDLLGIAISAYPYLIKHREASL